MFATIFLFAVFQMSSIHLGDKILQVEIANTAKTRALGLTGRKELLPDRGMLFIFDQEQTASFWMKDTLIPLSIGFFDKDQRLIETLEMSVLSGDSKVPPVYLSSPLTCYALEMPQNWFQKNRIVRGMKFSFLDHANRVE